MTTGVDANTTVKAAFERAVELIQAGDLRSAETTCRAGLEYFPEDGNLLCLLGGVLVRQRRPAEAEQALQSVIERFPDFAKAHEELGNAMLAQQRLREAADYLQRTLELEPGNDIAKLKLEKVEAALKQAGASSSDAETNSTGFLQDVLARDPDNADAYRHMAIEALQQGHSGDAIVLLQKAVAIDPEFTPAWLDLGRAFEARAEFTAAIDATQHAIELAPTAPTSHMLKAGYLARSGRYQEAIGAYNDGLATSPGNRDCLLGLGHTLRTTGRLDGAVTVYRELLRSDPGDAEAYFSLANLKSVRFEPAEIEAMHEHLAFDDFDDESRAQLLFSLGKACEDDLDYKRSYRYYEEGNAVRRGHESYDPIDTQSANDTAIEFFDTGYFADNPPGEGQAPTPIFIVGLPRTGSTLVEQILASHSKVDGTRELAELDQLIGSFDAQYSATGGYPAALSQCTAEQLAKLGRDYLDATARYRSGADNFTDKMPTNFRYVGFIHQVLPNAKIINVRRHPLDSCLGSYKQLFLRGHSYSYDLFELGEYYLEYQRLMDHWHDVLPGLVLDVHYEELVAAPDAQIRRMLDYCGLDWEEACLSFHETERAIESASSEQVRQPIYRSSVNNWRHFEDELGELIEILRPLLAKLPPEQRPAAMD